MKNLRVAAIAMVFVFFHTYPVLGCDPSEGSKKEEKESLQSDAEDLASDIGHLRRNGDSYDDEEYSRRLKQLESEAEDLSDRAGELDMSDAQSALEDSESGLKKLRRDIEDQPRYFYKERDDEVPDRTKKAEGYAEDATSDP